MQNSRMWTDTKHLCALLQGIQHSRQSTGGESGQSQHAAGEAAVLFVRFLVQAPPSYPRHTCKARIQGNISLLGVAAQ